MNKALITLGIATMLYTGANSQGFAPNKKIEYAKMAFQMPPEKTNGIDNLVKRGFQNSGVETPNGVQFLLKYYGTFSSIIMNLREIKDNMTYFKFKITDRLSCKITYLRWDEFNKVKTYEFLADFKFDL